MNFLTNRRVSENEKTMSEKQKTMSDEPEERKKERKK
jgi:hypothetical protein